MSIGKITSPVKHGKSPGRNRKDDIDAESVGGQIRQARDRKGLTSTQLGNLVGVSHATIIRTERGTTIPDKTTLIRLAQELNDHFGVPWLKPYAKTTGPRRVPIEARVAAGQPIDEIVEGESVLADPDLIKLTGDICALSVKGDSMIDHHILDRDVLICRKTAEPRNRSIVVVDFREGIGASVKFWYRRGDLVRLSSDPDAQQGEKFEFSAAKLGRVYEIVGLIRNFR